MTAAAVRSRAAAAVAGLAVVAGLGVVVALSRRVWFFGDDWSFLLGRSLSGDTLDSLFEPHNEHWSTVPVLAFRAVYGVLGLRHYLAYTGPVLLAHAVVCLLVWVLSRRAGARPWAATAAVVVVAFPGAGAEDVLWDFQIGFVGSVAFGLLAVWAADHDGGDLRRDVLAVVAAVLAFASSGMGAVVWVLYALVLLTRRGVRAAVVLAGIPAAVFVLWFLVYGRDGLAGDATPRSAYLQLPEYLWRGLSNAWGDAAGYPAAGPALVVVVVGATLLLVARRPVAVPDGLRLLAVAGIGTAVFLYLFVGTTRVRFGTDQAEVSRYAYIAVVLTAFAIAALLTALSPARGPAPDDAAHADAEAEAEAEADGRPTSPSVRNTVPLTVAVVVVLGVVTVAGVRQLVDFADGRAGLLAQIRPQLLGAVQLAREGAPVLSEQPEPTFSPDVTMTALRSPAVQDAFGPVTATPQGVLDARARVQTRVSTTDPGLPAPAAVTWVGVTGPAPTTTGCSSGEAVAATTVEVTPGSDGRAAFRLSGPTAGVQLTLVADGRTSAVVDVTVPADGAWVATVASGAVVRIVLTQASSLTVCAGG